MRSFATLVTIIFVTTIFLFGCTPLTEEQKEVNEFQSMILSVLEREATAGRINIHRVTAKHPTTRSGPILIEAIKRGYLSKGPELERYDDGRYWINEGSVPAIVKRFKIYPLIVKEIHFRITNNPSPTKIAFYEGVTVEYEFEGKLNKFGKFLKERGVKVLPKGVGTCTMEKRTINGVDEWHIS